MQDSEQAHAFLTESGATLDATQAQTLLLQSQP
ncbi:MAG: hypothetical protein ETSY2_36205 [Candidatus Entotheonella gemina]|uniref:Uncharacterized protein n=1 Tax=Candidatus Entotheonella gemina TaxID=1429439 RepID=W4LWD9_9BACT|nr:MAG: hypothetical protein ETSY2_36205 [Candidatus Entotheonella gemina]